MGVGEAGDRGAGVGLDVGGVGVGGVDVCGIGLVKQVIVE